MDTVTSSRTGATGLWRRRRDARVELASRHTQARSAGLPVFYRHTFAEICAAPDVLTPPRPPCPSSFQKNAPNVAQHAPDHADTSPDNLCRNTSPYMSLEARRQPMLRWHQPGGRLVAFGANTATQADFAPWILEDGALTVDQGLRQLRKPAFVNAFADWTSLQGSPKPPCPPSPDAPATNVAMLATTPRSAPRLSASAK